mmetsp:Transcript_9912/g.14952  ORF Transcript_9912/g.14952 Transcript_9912/m.14952 type:complete len:347 (+) Transcript_9912:43-1083(+)
MLKGHERGIRCLKFNREGDLLFSSANSKIINCWYAENGNRLGTYNGHTGAINDLDVNHDTSLLLSASSDESVRLWDVKSGQQLLRLHHKIPCRAVNFAEGEKMFLVATDNVFSKPSEIFVYPMGADADTKPMGSFVCGKFKVQKALWGPLNEAMFTASDNGKVHVWDAQSGKLLHEITDHTRSVQSIEFSKDRSMFLTASSDHTARLYDTKTLKLLKTYESGRPCNGACFSPLMDHVILAGGQPASMVTTERADQAGFATRIYHKVHQEEMALVMGHFGTVTALQFNPNGKSFCTGGEDGYIRVNFLDDDYFKKLSDEVFYKQDDDDNDNNDDKRSQVAASSSSAQ